ncbi:MAG: CAP domain-containing protein [Aliishimia sp.]
MSQASALEQEMLELVNAERAKVGVEPLTFDDNLNTAAEDHSSWMLQNDVFDHQGADRSAPKDRAVDAGYVLEGVSAVGENIAWRSIRGEPGLSDDVEQAHELLMTSPAHKAAILNPLFTEIGIGIEQGDYFTGGQNWDSIMVTQNFGTTEAEDFEPMLPQEEVTPNQPAMPEDVETVEEPLVSEDLAPEKKEEETVEVSETADEKAPQDNTSKDMTQEPAETNKGHVFTGFDWSDWGNSDFFGDFFNGSGNNNGNGNTGGGINGQGNGFGNNGNGVNGTGNGNGNSDWWNDQFNLTDAAFEPHSNDNAHNTNTGWSWGSMDFANSGEFPELALSFDDCFFM